MKVNHDPKAVPEKDCCSGKSPPSPPPEHSCCHGDATAESVTPTAAAKYFCPMCAGVESDVPGDCPMCGMALELNPAWVPAMESYYTCPMHPEIRQAGPRMFPAQLPARH